MPGTSKRNAAGGGRSGRREGGRREGARPAKRGSTGRGDRKQAHRIGWSRRIGAALALVLLIGAGIAFASGALDRATGIGDGTARETLPPPPAPTLIAMDPALTRLAAVDVSGTLPANLRRGTEYQLRIFVNDRLARERGLPNELNFTISDVPLAEGANEITAALVADGSEGEQSAPVTIARDSTPPAIRITTPDEGATVYGPTETLRGRTQAGASLVVAAVRSGEEVTATVAEDGRFEALLPLHMGENVFALHSEDLAGNQASTRLVVTRALSLASISLTVSVTQVAVSDLPSTVDIVAHVRDELGRASDGAQVTFSLSPPNRGTTTYRATTAQGDAGWPGMVVAGDTRAVGTWLVTVLVTLSSGEELRGDATFSVL